MLSKQNIILLLAVTVSALYVTDLRVGIKWQTELYGKAQENAIRLEQEEAQLRYEYSQNSDSQWVIATAKQMNMREPKSHEIIEVK